MGSSLNNMSYPSRGPFIYGCVMLGTMEILAHWIPRSAAIGLGVLTAQIIDYKWFDESQQTLTAWLLKTAIFMVVSTTLVLVLDGISSWYFSRN